MKLGASLLVLQEVDGKMRGRLNLGTVQQILAFLEMCVKGKRSGFLQFENRPAGGLRGSVETKGGGVSVDVRE